jgi:hypothetical protein
MYISTRRGALFVGISLVTAAGAPRLSAQAVLRGILYDDSTGTRLRGTVMLVDPATDAPVLHMTTASLGQFSMRFSGGTFQVAAIHPGYTSVLSAPMSFQSGELMTIRIPIAPDGDPKHQIGVLEHVRPGDANRQAASPRRASLEGFQARRSLGTGLHYDHGQLVRSQLRTLGSFLQTVPGFRVGDPSSTNSMSMLRNQAAGSGFVPGNACRIAWFLDGHRLDLPGRNDPMTDALGATPLENIAGVEIFRGVSEIPAEFAEPDVRCGAVAVWTRVG